MKERVNDKLLAVVGIKMCARRRTSYDSVLFLCLCGVFQVLVSPFVVFMTALCTAIVCFWEAGGGGVNCDICVEIQVLKLSSAVFKDFAQQRYTLLLRIPLKSAS